MIEQCPFCHKGTDNPSNQYKLEINIDTGLFNCFRCNAKGNWYEFTQLFEGNMDSIDFKRDIENKANFLSEQDYFLFLRNLLDNDEAFKPAIKYLTKNMQDKNDLECRHLDFDVLKKYKIGLGFETFQEDTEYYKIPVIYFPMYTRKKKKQNNNILLQYKIKNFNNQQQDQSQNENQDEKQDENNDNSNNIIDTNYQVNNEHSEIVKCKFRGMSKALKQYQRMYPSGKIYGIFGLNTVDPNAQEVIVTEGEFDAMAAYQATGIPSVSLPNGANSFPNELIHLFDQFQKIYLWTDSDKQGQEAVTKISKIFGQERTYIVKPPKEVNNFKIKDANDALKIYGSNSDEIKSWIKNSKTQILKDVLSISDLNEQIIQKLFRYNQTLGTPSLSFDSFNKSIKGLRMGELTVLTGLTGVGKTTFLSQYSLDFASQGIRTLWGSFEVNTRDLLTIGIQQFSEENLYKSPENYKKYLDQFNQLPIRLLDRYGHQNYIELCNIIENAIDKEGIKHIILDNLQFLMGTEFNGYQVFIEQDRVIEKLRRIATDKNVHITLVIHPKKSNPDEDLDIHSFFGNAKCTQEADNVIIIQKRDKYRVLDIKKNRKEGELAFQALVLDKTTKRYYEANHNEILELNKGKIRYEQVVQNGIQKYKDRLKIQLQEYENQNNGGNSGGPNNDNGNNNFNPGNTNNNGNNSQGGGGQNIQNYEDLNKDGLNNDNIHNWDDKNEKNLKINTNKKNEQQYDTYSKLMLDQVKVQNGNDKKYDYDQTYHLHQFKQDLQNIDDAQQITDNDLIQLKSQYKDIELFEIQQNSQIIKQQQNQDSEQQINQSMQETNYINQQNYLKQCLNENDSIDKEVTMDVKNQENITCLEKYQIQINSDQINENENNEFQSESDDELQISEGLQPLQKINQIYENGFNFQMNLSKYTSKGEVQDENLKKAIEFYILDAQNQKNKKNKNNNYSENSDFSINDLHYKEYFQQKNQKSKKQKGGI
ncbi:P-loop containing nucleoside triphosphate hydrolase [Pseudocohnilembus persalinus]|uniref:p-loop containing nucleoside triphosphate hydrolase n=1 Tax=Pseudocohnilembus persalinus TaxID=266149 RepID=A0A0V0QRE7_PSEPJ|nr:P-loop containing nucleoside triphosphate hydrolase [Pseudocohnilembus persalinus]|eukprot:KRX04592.1 P-loop containing nucleoside triphosphate hydrolase [Pseudocohnilembus persalinus]